MAVMCHNLTVLCYISPFLEPAVEAWMKRDPFCLAPSL